MVKHIFGRGRELTMIFMTALLSIFAFIVPVDGKEGTSHGSVATTLNDQESVAITIYNIDLALVKDIRDIQMGKGTGDLRFVDVASQIIPSSVFIRSLKDPASLGIIEQNYEYDLLNPEKLLDKYVGKTVKLYRMNPYTERESIVEAVVLSNNGGPIFQIADEITFGHPGRIIFPGVPEDLIPRPTLVWTFENTLNTAQKVEASYLTRGINWKADYVVTLNSDDTLADIAGWVTIDNKSGAQYKNATLKLVAGDVHMVKDEPEYRKRMMYAVQSRMAEEQFVEDEFFEYHIYTLKRPSTIKNNQTKQISLLKADMVPVKKELVYQGAQHYYRSRNGSIMTDQKVSVHVNFENRKRNNLGMPLPKGTVRVYKHDKEDSLQFAGEDRIDHTPKDEKVRVKLGNAFDVVGSRKQTDWKKIAQDTYEAGFEISLRNHKKEDVTVKVIEPVPGDWQMLSSSHNYEKTGAFKAEFNIKVPRDEEVKITYNVRMRF
jgi:hypothetical protein